MSELNLDYNKAFTLSEFNSLQWKEMLDVFNYKAAGILGPLQNYPDLLNNVNRLTKMARMLLNRDSLNGALTEDNLRLLGERLSSAVSMLVLGEDQGLTEVDIEDLEEFDDIFDFARLSARNAEKVLSTMTNNILEANVGSVDISEHFATGINQHNVNVFRVFIERQKELCEGDIKVLHKKLIGMVGDTEVFFKVIRTVEASPVLTALAGDDFADFAVFFRKANVIMVGPTSQSIKSLDENKAPDIRPLGPLSITHNDHKNSYGAPEKEASRLLSKSKGSVVLDGNCVTKCIQNNSFWIVNVGGKEYVSDTRDGVFDLVGLSYLKSLELPQYSVSLEIHWTPFDDVFDMLSIGYPEDTDLVGEVNLETIKSNGGVWTLGWYPDTAICCHNLAGLNIFDLAKHAIDNQ